MSVAEDIAALFAGTRQPDGIAQIWHPHVPAHPLEVKIVRDAAMHAVVALLYCQREPYKPAGTGP